MLCACFGNCGHSFGKSHRLGRREDNLVKEVWHIDPLAYDSRYADEPEIFGPAAAVVVDALRALPPGSRVLDLGSGQGRHAIAAAELGHRVVAVDISPTGIEQCLARTSTLEVLVQGVVADVRHYEPEGTFDLLLLYRIVHMIDADTERKALLGRAAEWLSPGGRLLVSEPENCHALVEEFFDHGWSVRRLEPNTWVGVRSG